MTGKIDIVFGGNVGSEGKGKFVGYLSQKKNYRHVVENFYPNAGHTWISDEGEKVVTTMLPTSLVNLNSNLYIGPAAALDVEKLLQEINTYDPKYKIRERLFIHPNAVVVQPCHIEEEKQGFLQQSGSTFKGGGTAAAYKAMRNIQKVKLAGEIPELKDYLQPTERMLHDALDRGEDILIEGSQGFDLDINYGIKYPHTTSRQTTPSQLLADAGLPIHAVRDIFAIMRTYPIRIAGNSGEMPDQELEWEDLQKLSGTPPEIDLTEYTTVTKQKRRISMPNLERMKYMLAITQPTQIFLNFINYINYEDFGKMDYTQLSEASKQWINQWETCFGMPINYLGTGPRNCEIIAR